VHASRFHGANTRFDLGVVNARCDLGVDALFGLDVNE